MNLIIENLLREEKRRKEEAIVRRQQQEKMRQQQNQRFYQLFQKQYPGFLEALEDLDLEYSVIHSEHCSDLMLVISEKGTDYFSRSADVEIVFAMENERLLVCDGGPATIDKGELRMSQLCMKLHPLLEQRMYALLEANKEVA